MRLFQKSYSFPKPEKLFPVRIKMTCNVATTMRVPGREISCPGRVLFSLPWNPCFLCICNKPCSFRQVYLWLGIDGLGTRSKSQLSPLQLNCMQPLNVPFYCSYHYINGYTDCSVLTSVTAQIDELDGHELFVDMVPLGWRLCRLRWAGPVGLGNTIALRGASHPGETGSGNR